MSCTRYSHAIHERVDGTLGPARRAELQTHLDVCPACRALAADLQKIRDAAATLEPVRPPEHVWLQIASRLRQEGRVADAGPARSRHTAMLAIAATLMLAVGGSLYLLFPLGQGTEGGAQIAGAASGNAAGADPVEGSVDETAVGEKDYQEAITALQELARAKDGSIDPQTAAVIEENIKVLDKAIAESRSALKAEPQSTPARESLFDALSHKVTLLQNTISLMNEMRKGNSAGAAQLVDGANKS
jgi:anti-sigma factor RsiW